MPESDPGSVIDTARMPLHQVIATHGGVPTGVPLSSPWMLSMIGVMGWRDPNGDPTLDLNPGSQFECGPARWRDGLQTLVLRRQRPDGVVD